MRSLRVGAEWRRVQGCVALADSPIPKTHLCNMNAPHPAGNTQVGSLYMALLRRGQQERNELAFATHQMPAKLLPNNPTSKSPDKGKSMG